MNRGFSKTKVKGEHDTASFCKRTNSLSSWCCGLWTRRLRFDLCARLEQAVVSAKLLRELTWLRF